MAKNPAYQCSRHKTRGFNPWVGEDSLEQKTATHAVTISCA